MSITQAGVAGYFNETPSGTPAARRVFCFKTLNEEGVHWPLAVPKYR
jgi:hypothetical protein